MQWQELITLARQELKQREEEGCDVSALRAELDQYVHAGKEDSCAVENLLTRVEQLVSPYEAAEPSDLSTIRKLRPSGPRKIEKRFSYAELQRRLHGAWLGRCAGCLLGKPVEGYSKHKVRLAAELGPGYPLERYFGAIVNPPEELGGRDWSPTNPSLVESLDGMPRDDDIDYTILALTLIERKGFDFSTDDVAALWLEQLPYHRVYTAERIAYRNLVNGLRPPDTATFRNPCREWIGAQIRADLFGYVSPGMPERAAELAYRDARLSHTKNGIYGEMFVAAMIAAAFVVDDVREIVEIGLSEIPSECRLRQAIDQVVEWVQVDGDWDKTSDRINEAFGHYQGCHTITNAAVVVLGLLYGELDFTRSIGIAVMAGHDTDCNGATVGSIVGVAIGADAIPQVWQAPIGDKVHCALVDVGTASLNDLVARTTQLASDAVREGV